MRFSKADVATIFLSILKKNLGESAYQAASAYDHLTQFQTTILMFLPLSGAGRRRSNLTLISSQINGSFRKDGVDMAKEGFKRLASTLAVAGLVAFIFQPLYTSGGTCDYLFLALLIGIPFGIQKMFLWFFPCGYGIAGTVGMFAFDIMLGGLIGCFVFCFRILSSLFYLLISVKELFRLNRF